MAESVTAALKLKWYSVELVREYSKPSTETLSPEHTDPFLISAEQYRRLSAMQGKVDIVISDRALSLGLLYAPETYRYHLSVVIQALTAGWQQLHVLVEPSQKKLMQHGTKASLAESKAEQAKVRQLLTGLVGSDYTVLDLDANGVNTLLNKIMNNTRKAKR